MQRRRALALGSGAALSLAWGAGIARAQTPAFPTRPIRLIVATAPGTGGDIVARLVGTSLSRRLGQPLIVENRPGAGGALAMGVGASAAPDGYTWTVGTSSTLITTPAINASARYDVLRDFVPIAGLAESAYVILTANTTDAPKTLEDLLRRLKTQDGSYGSLGIGTFGHLSTEYLLKRAGVKAVHVPYRSSGLTDVVSGQLLFASETIAGAMPLIRAGKLRALAVTSLDRIASLPSVPTVSESATPEFRLAQFKVTAWWALFAPAGTPSSIVRAASDAAVAVLKSEDMRSQLIAGELQPMPMNDAQLGALVHKELPLWTGFVEDLGLKSK